MEKLSTGNLMKQIAQEILEQIINEGSYFSYEKIMKDYFGVKKNSSELERFYAKRRAHNIISTIKRNARKQGKEIVAIAKELLELEGELQKEKYTTIAELEQTYKRLIGNYTFGRESMEFGIIQSSLQAIAVLYTRDRFIKGNIDVRNNITEDINQNAGLPAGNKIKKIGEVSTLLLLK